MVCDFCRCTAVTALIMGRNLIVANVGDSRAVIWKDGKGTITTVISKLRRSFNILVQIRIAQFLFKELGIQMVMPFV